MKFLFPVALLALGASAQTTATSGSSKCDADFIVTECLSSETAKLTACDYTDYDCQCAAAQAIQTCYNNCPNDPRGSDAAGQVKIYCDNASIHGSKAMASRTAAVATATGKTSATVAATTTEAEDSETTASGTATGTAASATTTNAAAEMIRNTGGVLLAVAGVVAAVL